MSASVREIVTDAQGIVGEVAGVGVQAFSEDRMRDDAVRGFDMMFKKYYWEQFLKWDRLLLDGTLGIVTTDELELVKDFEDISSVHPDGLAVQLPVLPRKLNPFAAFNTGTSVVCWTSLNTRDANFPKRKLQFYPKTSVGYVNICSRQYPLDAIAETWDWEDIMYLDRSLLAYATAFMTLVGDDLNPGAAGVVKSLLEGKFKDITGALAGRPLAMPTVPTVPNRWAERV